MLWYSTACFRVRKHGTLQSKRVPLALRMITLIETFSRHCIVRGALVSIIRVGLAETKRFAEGYDAIFSKKKSKSDGKKPRAAVKKKKAVKKK
jgi:hypothetical protein